MLKNLNFILTLAIFLAFISGCGKTDQKQEQQTSEENKTTDQVQNLQQPAGEQPQTKTEGKNELGISEGIPADYPEDVPKPMNSKAMGYLTTQEGMVVTFESVDKPKDIFKAFEEELEKNNFKKSEDAQMKDEGGMCMWKKDKREVSIMLAWQSDKHTTSSVITYK